MTGINPNIISHQEYLLPCRSFSQAMERHDGQNITNVSYKALQDGVQDLYRINGSRHYAFLTTLEVGFADGAKETLIYEGRASNKELFCLLGKPIQGKVSDKQARQVSIDLLKGLEVAAKTGDLGQVKALEGHGTLKVHGCKDKHLSLAAAGQKLHKYASQKNDKLDGDSLTLEERASRFNMVALTEEEVSAIVRNLLNQHAKPVEAKVNQLENVNLSDVEEPMEAQIPSKVGDESESSADSVSTDCPESFLSRIGSATAAVFNAHPVKTSLLGLLSLMVTFSMATAAMRSEIEI